jgi:hypothetical protein
MAYPLQMLENLSVRIQELLGDYQRESSASFIPRRNSGRTREEEFDERNRKILETSNNFMKKAGTELLPNIQSVLAEIEVLLDSEEETLANRVYPILKEAETFAMHPTNPLGYYQLCSLLMRLKGQLGIRVIIRPNIFVGYRYAEDDEKLAEKFMRLFELEKLNPISGKTAKAEDVDDKIKSMISASHGVIIIFTREEELTRGGWATSSWLTTESAFALGQNKLVGLFFEDCISVKQRKGIQGDLEYIEFNREHIEDAFLEALPYLRDFRQRILEK